MNDLNKGGKRNPLRAEVSNSFFTRAVSDKIEILLDLDMCAIKYSMSYWRYKLYKVDFSCQMSIASLVGLGIICRGVVSIEISKET